MKVSVKPSRSLTLGPGLTCMGASMGPQSPALGSAPAKPWRSSKLRPRGEDHVGGSAEGEDRAGNVRHPDFAEGQGAPALDDGGLREDLVAPGRAQVADVEIDRGLTHPARRFRVEGAQSAADGSVDEGSVDAPVHGGAGRVTQVVADGHAQ